MNTIEALMKYQSTINQLPGQDQAAAALAHMMTAIFAGVASEDIYKTLAQECPQEVRAQHIAVMEQFIKDLAEG